MKRDKGGTTQCGQPQIDTPHQRGRPFPPFPAARPTVPAWTSPTSSPRSQPRFKAHPDKSDRWVAAQVNVGRTLISEVRKDVKLDDEISGRIKDVINIFDSATPERVDRSLLGSNGKAYTIARLRRDGYDALADQVEAGDMSARRARIQIGWERPKVTVSWEEGNVPNIVQAFIPTL